MFFFGALSGNLLYLVLAVSYLAGCSAMVFRSSSENSKEIQPSGSTTIHNLYASYQTENYSAFQIKNNTPAKEIIAQEIATQPPIVLSAVDQFSPPLYTGKSHYSGSALFSRPPPHFPV